MHRWLKGLFQVPGAELVAIAGRTKAKVDAVADQYKIPTRFYSYEELARFDGVDVVYIASPHSAHLEHSRLAIAGGKAVLCEKPVTVNGREFSAIQDALKATPVFFMEAFWTRFFPASRKLQELLRSGVIGEVKQLVINFGFVVDRSDPADRLINPGLAGGTLLDIGCYTLQFADIVFGKKPVEIVGVAHLAAGIDEQAAYVAKYDNGALFSAALSFQADMVDTAVIYGTRGRIRVPVFWKPTVLEITTPAGTTTFESPVPGGEEGYQYQIAHVHECLANGLTESPVMTLAKSAEIMGLCDALRAQWQLKYPSEE